MDKWRKEALRVVIRWAIDAQREDGQAFFVDQWYTASLGAKAILRQHLELWRGKAFEENHGWMRFDSPDLDVDSGCS